jgi:hypothetical protein
MRADLHIHSTASDGSLSPDEIVKVAVKLGLNAIAITDHDSVEGLEPALAAARNFPNFLVIPGVELSTDTPEGEVHILGYFIDRHHQGFRKALQNRRQSRLKRGQKMVAKLADMGIHIDWEQVSEIAKGGAVGRPHIAQAMLKQGYVSTLQQAFTEYIGRDCPAYVERERLSPTEALGIIIDTGGLPVLAHPAKIEGLKPLILELKQAGLVGLEAYYNGYTKEVMAWLDALAHDYGLIPSGGSDYHGIGAATGSEIGAINVPWKYVAQLIALAGKAKV